MADSNLISTDTRDASPTITVDTLLQYNAANSSLGIDFSNYTYDGLRSQLYSKMSENEELVDLIPASTVSIIVDLVAAIGDFDQYSIESALQENFYDTAKLSTSVYKIARSQGVRLQRNIPCWVSVSLYREVSNTIRQIPKWSQFKIGQVYFFNREPIVFSEGVTQVNDVILYQGEIKYQDFISDGSKFQVYEVGDTRFAIAEDDVRCWVGGEEWTRDLRGLFTYSLGDKKWYENTLSNGLMQVKFGNDIYGKCPDIGVTIRFGYANTLGSNAQAPATDVEVTMVGDSAIKGTATTAIQDGDMYRDSYYYSKMGASLSSVNERAVTRKDYRAYITKYPGIRDGLIRGQAEIAPNRKEWMNVLAITAITDMTWTDSQFQGLVDWLRSEYSMYSMNFARVDPIAYDVDIDVRLICEPSTDLATMKSTVSNALIELLRPKVGTLGKALYRSDIENAILQAGGSMLDKYVLNTPQADFVVRNTEYLRLGDLTITAELRTDAFE